MNKYKYKNGALDNMPLLAPVLYTSSQINNYNLGSLEAFNLFTAWKSVSIL